MVYLYLTSDFSLKYVKEKLNIYQPHLFKILNNRFMKNCMKIYVNFGNTFFDILIFVWKL